MTTEADIGPALAPPEWTTLYLDGQPRSMHTARVQAFLDEIGDEARQERLSFTPPEDQPTDDVREVHFRNDTTARTQLTRAHWAGRVARQQAS